MNPSPKGNDPLRKSTFGSACVLYWSQP